MSGTSLFQEMYLVECDCKFNGVVIHIEGSKYCLVRFIWCIACAVGFGIAALKVVDLYVNMEWLYLYVEC